ncbi:SCO7613 C-terminal domain-containing membrane protein [Leifsonia poae]|uniref:SCO7613 C-terminal domain-containing membrane protein n=1 Tax=Leifsonia poae TaxID=110933 RepID=UPI003D665CAE
MLFVIWFRFSRLRVASVAAFSTFPIGAGLLAAGLTADAAPYLDLYFGFLASAVATLVWVFLDPLVERMHYPVALTAERIALLTLGSVAAIGATLSAVFAVPDWAWAPAVTMGALVILGLAHGIPLTLHERSAGLRRVGVVVCAAVGLLPAAAAALVSLRTESPIALIWWPLLLGVVVAAGCDVFASRWASVRARGAFSGGALGAGISAAVAFVSVAVVAALPLVNILSARRTAWVGEPFAPLVTPSEQSIAAVLALAAAVIVAGVAWFAARLLSGPRAIGAAWVALVGVAFAIPFLAAPLVIVVVCLALAAAALWVLARFTELSVSLRAPVRTAAILLPALAYIVSFAEFWSWSLASVGAIGVALAFRAASKVEARLFLLLGTVAFLFVSVALAPIAVHEAFPPTGVDRGVAGVAEWLAVAAGAIALILAVPVRGFATALERSGGFVLAAIAGTVAFGWQLQFESAAPGTGIMVPDVVAFAAGVLAVAAIAVWLTAPQNRDASVGRIAAALLAALALWTVVVEAVRILSLVGITIDPAAGAVIPGVVVLIVVVAGYVSALLNADIGRTWTDAGAVILFVGALVAALGSNLPIILLFGALATVVAAIDADGLLRSTSWRRHLGWLALALGVGALWVQLGRADVTSLEPYVLPLSAALLVVAVLVWSFRPSTDRYRLGIAALVFAGLSASLVPLAISDAETTVRSVVVGIVSAVLVIVPLFVPLGDRAVAERTAIALAGATGVVATVARHAQSPGSDIWLAVGFVVLAAGAWGLARLARDAAIPPLERASGVALAVTVAFGGLVALVGVAPDQEVRALVLVSAATAIAVLGFVIRRSPLTPVVGWAGYGVAVLLSISALTIGQIDPFEVVTVPLALGLLVHGWFRMRGSELRSWPALGPGLVVLLIPPLIADYGPSVLWRAVALGVVALAVLVAGLLLRWQAPFVLGGVVLIWHAIAQLWPWISDLYETVPWWLWLGIGGAILIALAARYEHRIQNARSIVASISALR